MSTQSVKNPAVWQASLGLLGGLGLMGTLYTRQGSQIFKVAKGVGYAQSLSHLVQLGIAVCMFTNGLIDKVESKGAADRVCGCVMGGLWLAMAASGVVKGLSLTPGISVPLHCLGALAYGLAGIGFYKENKMTPVGLSMFAFSVSHLLSCARSGSFASRNLAAFTSVFGSLVQLGGLLFFRDELSIWDRVPPFKKDETS